MMEGREFWPNDAEAIEEQTETLFQKQRCCFCCPRFTSSSGRSTPSVRFNFWHRIRMADTENTHSLWARGVSTLKGLRLWSEVVAGPRWKNFIRRFSRTKSQNARHAKYQYDALSYAMNFDEGPGQNGNFEEEEDHVLRNFSVRYASVPANTKSPMDFGKGGPSFV